jgi:glycosyltransferase involved in cell wall biosynthesis
VPRRPRHVGLNALFLEPGRSAGPETYLRGLVPALAAGYPETRFTVVTTRKGADALVADGWTDFCSIVRLRADEGERLARLRAEQLTYPVLGARRGWDVLHSLASVAPVRTWTPHVISLHDVNFFHHRTFGLATTLAMRTIVGAAARHADAFVAVSATARDDIVATLGIAPERIVLAPNGADQVSRAEPLPAAEVRRRRDLPPDAQIVLCVAAMRPHKNQALLVRALAHLPESVVVVLAGHPETYAAELAALAGRIGVAGRLRIAGYVEDAELEALWGMASCAAFPTLAEGFGLPLVEALQRGVPVAASDIAVLHEVGGPTPSWFDPHDPADAARAIARALAQPRDDPRARAWAGRFTWEAAAERTWEAYELALSGRRNVTMQEA